LLKTVVVGREVLELLSHVIKHRAGLSLVLGILAGRPVVSRGSNMFSHVLVGSDDVAISKKFYDAALGAIGVPEGKLDAKGRVFYRTSTGTFGISKPIDGNAATYANGGTIGFTCDSADKVKAFHDAAVASGGKSIEDPPGWREGGAVRVYLAYLRDPFGNKICALYRG
jgi:catechol 2,3-dioxygenase-like lactoylglutathione lyase family enzyme